MVGIEEPVAEGILSPVEGNNGAISGESSWKGELGFGLGTDGKASNGEAMKTIMTAEQYQKEAILMMMKSLEGV